MPRPRHLPAAAAQHPGKAPTAHPRRGRPPTDGRPRVGGESVRQWRGAELGELALKEVDLRLLVVLHVPGQVGDRRVVRLLQDAVDHVYAAQVVTEHELAEQYVGGVS